MHVDDEEREAQVVSSASKERLVDSRPPLKSTTYAATTCDVEVSRMRKGTGDKKQQLEGHAGLLRECEGRYWVAAKIKAVVKTCGTSKRRSFAKQRFDERNRHRNSDRFQLT